MNMNDAWDVIANIRPDKTFKEDLDRLRYNVAKTLETGDTYIFPFRLKNTIELVIYLKDVIGVNYEIIEAEKLGYTIGMIEITKDGLND